jgi:hypothetical protein
VSLHWNAVERRVLDRFAAEVRSGAYSNAVLAVAGCRAALDQLRRAGGGNPALPVRTRQGIHLQLIKRARQMGRPRILIRWNDEERAFLDRYAHAVAVGRFRNAREAGRACQEALQRLHHRCPKRYAGVPDRSILTINGELLPRVGKLLFRWNKSRWAACEMAIIDRHARALVAHRYPNLRAAARVCCDAINRMHARLGRRDGRSGPALATRTLRGVFHQLWHRAHELSRFQLPHRFWTVEEEKVAARWARKYDLHMRGRLRMNLLTIATLMQAELGRRGYYRNVQACVTRTVTHRRRLVSEIDKAIPNWPLQ